MTKTGKSAAAVYAAALCVASTFCGVVFALLAALLCAAIPAAANIITPTDFALTSTTTISTVNNLNQLTEDAAYTYTYDPDGNLITKTSKTTGDTTTYTYNTENQLTAVALPDGRTITYTYDLLGRRTSTTSASGETTRYTYDGNDVIATTHTQSATSTTETTAIYTHGPGIDNILAASTSAPDGTPILAATLYYHKDALQSVAALTNTDGNTTQTYTYDTFGNITASATINPDTGEPANPDTKPQNPFTYTARELDPDSGLYYYRARYYDPATGRFTSQDPVWHTNLYPYVGNNPLNFVDPMGENGEYGDAAKATADSWWDVASLGAHSKIQRMDKKNLHMSSSEFFARSVGIGVTSVTNALTLGYQDAIYYGQTEGGLSALEAAKKHTRSFLPDNEIRATFDKNLPADARVEAGLMAISKTATLGAMGAGILKLAQMP